MAKIYKSTRAKEAICKDGEKFVKFDTHTCKLITIDEEGITREYDLDFGSKSITVLSVSVGRIEFVATETDNTTRIIVG